MPKSRALRKTCPVCTFSNLELFFEMLEVPVGCSLLWPNQQAAQSCPRGDIKLAFCPSCGFITNVSFDPARLNYSQDYDNSLHYSPKFQEYAQSLGTRLVERHKLYDKDIIEIGCGKGDFLISLCKLANSRGVGFDPSYVVQPEHRQLAGRVQFIQDFYSEGYASYQGNLICCRHTLEHISNPADLLKPLRLAIGDRLGTVVFFEVPNALYTFQKLAVWDIIYEHCSYFTPVSLAHAFSVNEFRVCNISEEFAGQFICFEALPSEVRIEMRRSERQSEAVQQLANDINLFTARFHNKVESWNNRLEQIKRQGQKTVIWGAGAKGVSFLNLLKLQPSTIEYVVDINPRKQGTYVAGTGQEIIPPQVLLNYQPEVVIIMNSIYEDEIRQFVDSLGLAPEFISEDISSDSVKVDMSVLVNHLPLTISKTLTDLEKIAQMVHDKVQELANLTHHPLEILAGCLPTHLLLEKQLHQLFECIRQFMAVDTVTILQKSKKYKQELVVQVTIGLEEEVTQGIRIPIGQGFAGCIADRCEPLLVDDLSTVEIVSPVLRDSGIRSMAGVPLLAQGKAVGVFHVGTYRPRQFTRNDSQLLQLVANRVGLSLLEF